MTGVSETERLFFINLRSLFFHNKIPLQISTYQKSVSYSLCIVLKYPSKKRAASVTILLSFNI